MSTIADRRGRAGWALAGLAGLAAAAWLYLLNGAGLPMHGMDAMPGMMMPQTPAWTWAYAALVLGMWTVMMAAMMLPTAAPAVVRVARAGGLTQAAAFAAGYLAVWTGFGAAATFAQWGLDATHLLSDAMALRSAALAGVVIAGVGLYQMTPLKRGCLGRCRTHDGAPAAHRRSPWTAVPAGLRYGASCLGCCAALMALLFVGGLMNLLWAAAIAAWVLAEKTLPWGDRLARVSAAGLTAVGMAALVIALSRATPP